MTYKHLSQNERYQIFCLMKEGLNCTEIAKNLGRSTSTISREIVRNKGGRGYRPKQADRLAQERSVGSRNARRIEPDVLKAAFDRIAEQLSPEQVAAELPISHETLYQHIYADKAAGGALWKNLRCQKKRKKRYASGVERRGQIVGRRPIHERPANVELRRTVGHWEGDTVIGAGHKQAIVTLVERKSGYAVLMKVNHKTSELVSSAVIKKLEPIRDRVKTITFDYGLVFTSRSYTKLVKSYGLQQEFITPHCPEQNGLVERVIRSIKEQCVHRQRFETLQHASRVIGDWMYFYNNQRPHQALKMKTPSQKFEELKLVA